MKKTIFLMGLLISVFFASCSKESEQASKGANTPLPPGKIKEEDGMVLLRGGIYLRGNNKPPGNGDFYPEEGPAHRVEVSSFWIDKYEVTNAQFQEFVDATGYITFAERPLSKEVFPNAPAEQLVPGATVFAPPPKNINPRDTNDPWDWWAYRKAACWKRPNGEGSSIKNRMNHPVVCVNADDAKAYAKWAGKRLPTEAEWELAARGGTEGDMFIWGSEAKPNGKWMANCFQGKFPAKNTAQDGYLYTAPVGSFPPNEYGLYDMAGNVWEICSDFYHPAYYRQFLEAPHPNPTGPKSPITQIELEEFRATGTCPLPQTGVSELMFLHVTKGGSFLCHYDYCLRYRPAARHHSESLAPSNHAGFRCVKDIE
jgi:formylglycine-generating enzyme required for sulfatase activity